MITTNTHHRLRLLAPLVAFGVAAASCSQQDDEAADESATTSTTSVATTSADTAEVVAFIEGSTPCLVSDGGLATGEPIKVGSLQAESALDSAGQAAAAFFSCVNANGGINGRPVEFLVENDSDNPALSEALAIRLMESDGVVAFVANSSRVDCSVNGEKYVDANVLSIHGPGVSSTCYDSPNIAPITPGSRTSTLGIAQHLVEENDVESLACIAEDTATGGAWACGGVAYWGAQAGIDVTVVLHEPAELLADSLAAKVRDERLSNLDVGELLDRVEEADPDAVVFLESAADSVALLAEAEARDLRQEMAWGAPSSVYYSGFPEAIGTYWWGYLDVHTELTLIGAETTDNQAWLTTLERYGSLDDVRDSSSQAGWLAAKVFTDTLLDLDPGSIDRAATTEAIRGITTYPSDLGCGTWYYGAGDRHNPSQAGRIVSLNAAGRFELIKGCEDHDDPELTDLLASEQANEVVVN
jgi:branched-chain amino acid transport system substrate-binding protein